MNLCLQSVLMENFESNTFVHLTRENPSAEGGEGSGAHTTPGLTLMPSSECGHGVSRNLGVIFILFMIILEGDDLILSFLVFYRQLLNYVNKCL